MDWTVEQMMRLGSCYDEAKFVELWGGAESLTTAQFLDSEAPVADRAYIVTLMLDDATLRLWACDMLEAADPDKLLAPVEDLAKLISDARAAVEEGHGEAWYREQWCELRGTFGGARALFHWRGGAAARLAYKATHTREPDNAEELLGLLRQRIEE